MKGNKLRCLQVSVNIVKTIIDRMKLLIDEMILRKSPTKIAMESKLSDSFLLELLPLKSKTLTRWAIRAPWSLLLVYKIIIIKFKTTTTKTKKSKQFWMKCHRNLQWPIIFYFRMILNTITCIRWLELTTKRNRWTITIRVPQEFCCKKCHTSATK